MSPPMDIRLRPGQAGPGVEAAPPPLANYGKYLKDTIFCKLSWLFISMSK